MSAPTLRDYQHGGLGAVAHALRGGINRALLKLPTGTGKTVMFAEMLKHESLREWLAQWPKHGATMLVIAHREELLDQAAKKISNANPGLMVSIEQGDRTANRYSDVIVASIQTLAAVKFRRLKRLMQHHTPRIVIIDEAHHAAAATYRTALAHLGFLPTADMSDSDDIEAATHDDVEVMTKALEGWDVIAPKDRLLVGVTATPNRSDAVGLGCVFQSITYTYGLKEAIGDGWLVPIVPWVIETGDSLDQVKTVAGDFNQRDLANVVNNHRRNILALDAWKLYAGGRSTIAFTVDVAHAHAAADIFTADGIVAKAVSGETPKDERRQILADFTAGRVQVITNCMVLTEGTDLPITSCILHLKPTKSATLYEQMTGRGLRLYPEKADCIVIDLVDIARRHSLQAAPVLYGLPPGLKTAGKDLKALEEELEAFGNEFSSFDLERALAAGRFSIEELRARASTFNVFSIKALGEFGQGRTCDWLRVGDDIYQMTYPWGDGKEVLRVSKNLIGKWDVVQTMVPADGGALRQRTMAADVLTHTEGAEIAETFMSTERSRAMRLTEKDAPWKRNPATDKQKAYLTRLRVSFNASTLTSGQAGLLIETAKSRGARR